MCLSVLAEFWMYHQPARFTLAATCTLTGDSFGRHTSGIVCPVTRKMQGHVCMRASPMYHWMLMYQRMLMECSSCILLQSVTATNNTVRMHSGNSNWMYNIVSNIMNKLWWILRYINSILQHCIFFQTDELRCTSSKNHDCVTCRLGNVKQNGDGVEHLSQLEVVLVTLYRS